MQQEPEKTILFLQMGGTIDKTYPKSKGGYHFEIGQPALQNTLAKIKPSLGFKHKVKVVCQKDSQDIGLTER